MPLVHFGGDIFQVWGSSVGGRERFGCNSVVGWHVSDVSGSNGTPSLAKGGATASPRSCGLVSKCLQLGVYSLLTPLFFWFLSAF